MKRPPGRTRAKRRGRLRRLPAGCARYMEIQGKTVDFAELWNGPGGCSVTLWFRDKTCLHFNLQPGVSVQTDYFDWQSGEQRLIRRWPQVHAGIFTSK
jgi:hypothetical protein